VHASHIYRLQASGKRPPPATLASLELAVARSRSSEFEGDASTNALYRALLIVAALELGLDPLRVQMTDPRAKRTNNAEWLACVQAHWLARWCMNKVFGLSQAMIARSMGISKQAVNQSIESMIEREDEDPRFSTVLAGLREKLLGMA
jgi:hypothetical protein